MKTASPTAGEGPRAPTWRIEFECHGKPYNWTGSAPTSGLAASMALAQLAYGERDFNRYKARVIVCAEVTA